MTEIKYKINSPDGVHARPAGLLVKEASGFPNCQITLMKGDQSADGKRIFSVLALGVRQNDWLIIQANGEQEEEACQVLLCCLKNNL